MIRLRMTPLPGAHRIRSNRDRRAFSLKLAVISFLALAGCTSTTAAKQPARAALETRPPLDLGAAGPEQAVVQIPVPPNFVRAMANQPATGAVLIPGSEFAYTVDGGSPIGIEEVSRSLVVPGHPLSSARTVLSIGVWYIGTGGMNGTGYDGGDLPLGPTGSVATPIDVIPDWPTTGVQVYAWVHLPPSVKYVTYSFQGGDRTWVSPIRGTALLSVPRPAAYDGDYATWHTAPFGLLRAYDASGHLVAQQYAPRIGGDSVPRAS